MKLTTEETRTLPVGHKAEGPKLTGESILRLAAGTFLTRVFNLFILFVTDIIIAGMLGPAGKGYITNCRLWATSLSMFLALGLDSTAIYYVGKDHGDFRYLARSYGKYLLFSALPIVCLLWVLQGVADLFHGMEELFWPTAVLTLASLSIALFSAIFTGAGRLAYTNSLSMVGSSMLMVAVSGLYWASMHGTLPVLAAICAAQCVNALLLLGAGLKMQPPTVPSSIEKKNFISYSSKMYVSNLGGFLYMRANVMTLTLYSSMGEVGLYSMAQIFADLVFIFPNILINIVFPEVAGMSRDDGAARVSQASRFASTLSLISALGIAALSPVLIKWFLGGNFDGSIPITMVLLFGSWIAATGMITSIYFNAVNKPEIPAAGVWIGVIVAVVLTIVLAPKWGGYGAAVSLVCSRALVAVYLVVTYMNETHEKLSGLLIVRPDELRKSFAVFMNKTGWKRA